MSKYLKPYIKPYIAYAILIMLAAIISNASAAFVPTMIGAIIDGRNTFGSMYKDLVGIGIFVAVGASGAYAVSALSAYLASSITCDIRTDALKKLEGMSVSLTDTYKKGDLQSRLTNDCEYIGDGIFQFFEKLFSGIALIIVTFVFMVRLNIMLSLAVLALTPLSIFISGFIVKNTHKYFTESSNKLGSMSGFLSDSLQGIKQNIAYNHFRTDELTRRSEAYRDTAQRAQFFSSLVNPCTRFVNSATYIAVGFCAVGFGLLTPGGISAFLAYAVVFGRPINEITGLSVTVQTALASAKRITEFLQISTGESTSLPDIVPASGRVEIADVSFSYPSKRVLTDVSFTAEAGGITAIVGPTGSGKTTLINLLMRFYEPDSGEILLDDRHIDRYSEQSVRKCFGMVLQNTWLFNGTVKENIAFGKSDATDAEIEQAAKACSAHNFIERLEHGYNTVIGEDCSLSAGEKQLLCVTRVLLSAPPLVILDEATSYIDRETEEAVQSAFKQLMKGKTSIVIAHRLTTIKDADRIVVLKDGRVAESGTHDELIAQNGEYNRMYFV